MTRTGAKLLLLAMLHSFFAATAIGWHPYSINLNRANGLPSDAVYDVLQDKQGFMWLATGNGLSRYDGFSFSTVRSPHQTSAAGSCIQQDRMGRIWYENFDGYLYHTDGKSLLPLSQRQPISFMPYGITDSFLFVVQVNGIDVFNISNLALVKTIAVRFERLESSGGNKNSFYLIDNGILYRITNSLTVTSQKINAHNDKVVNQIYCNDSEVYIVPRFAANCSIISLRDGTAPPTTIKTPTVGIRNICKVGGSLWLISSSGCTDLSTNKVLFPDKSIGSITLDKAGNYWFSTTNDGVYIVPHLSTYIYSQPDFQPRQIAISHHNLLAGTHDGRILSFPVAGGPPTSTNSNKTNAEVYYLHADNDNIFYSSAGFTVETSKGSRKQTNISAIAVKGIFPIDSKYYAVAASGLCGMFRNPAAPPMLPSAWDSIYHRLLFNKETGMASFVNSVRARAVTFDTVGQTIYYATNAGLLSFSRTHYDTLRHLGQPIYAARLATYGASVYAATTKGQLLQITGNKATLIENLPGSGTVQLLKSTGGRLFYTADGLLYQYLSGSNAIVVNTHIDAHSINDIVWSDSCLWIAVKNGLVRIPHNIRPAKKAPIFYVNGMTVNGKQVNTTRTTHLHSGDQNIIINYSLIEYAPAVPSTVSYSLGNGTWKDLPLSTRSLSFQWLPPGQYNVRFRVNGIDMAGNISFKINAPFWQQPWFYVIATLLLFAASRTYYSIQAAKRVKKIEAQKQQLLLEEQLGRSKLTALRAQMNPHFFFNALNTIQAYIFTNEKAKAGNYLSKFSMLTRRILEMSETETIMLHEEIEAMKLYLDLEKMRFGNDFEYTIHTHMLSDSANIEIPSMILQPFIENAVKHGLLHKEGTKKLLIGFELHTSSLHITIDDNGIGRLRSMALNSIKNDKYKSFATRATAQRVQLINAAAPGRVEVETLDKTTADGAPAGTTVTVKIRI